MNTETMENEIPPHFAELPDSEKLRLYSMQKAIVEECTEDARRVYEENPSDTQELDHEMKMMFRAEALLERIRLSFRAHL